MKRVLLFALCAMCCTMVQAQDLIVLRSADDIQAKVTAITPESVTYKRWSNLEGPTYTIAKSDIFYIKYANGEKDVMQEPVAVQHIRQNTTSASSDVATVKLQGYVNLGTIFYEMGAGPALDINVGARIYEHLYLGFETGFHTVLTPYEYYSRYYGYEKGTYFDAYVPIGVNMKGYFTKGRKVNPYVNCSLGGFIGIGGMQGWNGFFCQAGLGVDIRRFSVSIGYNGLVEYYTEHLGYVKLGVRFGK